ncbi:VOC family protein [Nocardia aurantia]|uniref:Putative glyoxylase CFP32 n=1 Tax=Nocardia aurantia TaxID=2585199 RepID=A0A7K0DSJ8_9NOCA|nr:VOC family protein [Nocardia aurantia]MQY28721.1 putative glyoxylase CFP32 [Nocardia aurantia]
MAEVRTYPAGVTSWIDVECGDVEAAKTFYGNLFGWTFTDATPPSAPSRYVIAQLDGADVAGIGGPADPAAGSGPARWNTYVAVDDAQAAAALVVAAGGSVVTPPAPAGEGGISAVCADPAGARFRLWQAKRRPGAQLVNVPGAWNFSNLHTADPAAARAFYTEVFGWSIDDLGFATMIRRPGYGDHLAATVDPDIRERQSGDMVPPGFADAIGWVAPLPQGEAPHWHVAFTVADRDETASAAARLGGVVVSAADTGWTRDAVVRDPQGATFTASQFTPPS